MTLVIEMVSDLVCPWCWLGKRRMDDAIKLVPDLEVDLIFRPFELDPTIPVEGVDYKAHMKEKFGSDAGKDRANAMGVGVGLAAPEDLRRAYSLPRLGRWKLARRCKREALELLGARVNRVV